jgi:hypothetical protein
MDSAKDLLPSPAALERILREHSGGVAGADFEIVEKAGGEARSRRRRSGFVDTTEIRDFGSRRTTPTSIAASTGQWDEPAADDPFPHAEGRHDYQRACFRARHAPARPVRAGTQRARMKLYVRRVSSSPMTPIFCPAGCGSSASSSIPPTCRSTCRAR